MEKTREDRDRREAKADELAELAMDAVKAFLTNTAELLVENVDDNTRRVSFHFTVPR